MIFNYFFNFIKFILIKNLEKNLLINCTLNFLIKLKNYLIN